jgi:hypothetical protein
MAWISQAAMTTSKVLDDCVDELDGRRSVLETPANQ